ncbi:MAG TPA: hypothetical protein VGF29_01285 [Hyphomicrobiaceae bacterium]|jgi:hypothetical protein
MTRTARLAACVAALIALHAAMWCAVPWILDGPVLPSTTFGQRLVNVAIMAVWLWGLPLAAIVASERYLRRARGAFARGSL